MPLPITSVLSVPDAALSESFVRASGPGGQNVNKVATAVELRLDLGRLRWPEEITQRLRVLAGQRMTAGDVLLIEARANRTQGQNREAARARLVALLKKALIRPRTRRKTKPPTASRERRLDAKTVRSRTKQNRRKIDASRD